MRSARVRSKARSEPACGSVRFIVAVHSPETSLREIDVLQRVAGVRLDRLDRALAEQRAEREGHVGGVPDLRAGGVEEGRQAEAAMFGRRRERVPAAVDPLRIGLAPAGRRRHRALRKARADAIADPVEREQSFSREFRRLGQGRFGDAVAEIGVKRRSRRALRRRRRAGARKACRRAARGRSSRLP